MNSDNIFGMQQKYFSIVAIIIEYMYLAIIPWYFHTQVQGELLPKIR